MKQILRKSVSLLLSILMIVTVCSVGIISIVNAEETVTHYDLGVTDGTDVRLYDDPTGTGEKVLRINIDNTRPNFELSDPAVADGKTKFEPVAGTIYTIKFDYYISSTSTGTDMDFTLYYGARSASGGGYSKVDMNSASLKYGFSNQFIGDNKWHTMAISFKAATKTGSVAGTSGQPLPYLYLTYYSSKIINGYVKNIEIITETATSLDVTNESYTLDKYFNEDKTPNTTEFFKNDTISTNMSDSFVNEAGEKVFVPTIDTYYASSQSNARTSDFIAVIDSSGKYLPAVSGRTYNFIIKYKVLKLNDAGTHVAIGFGRASTADGKTVPILSKKITATSDEWQYLTGTITPNTTTKLHIYLAGTGAQIVIDHIEYTTYTANTTPWQVYNFNDNGDLHIRGQYPGTDFSVNYENEQNAAMGEHIMGWYTTPDFAEGTPTTKLPDAAATLYARYPTTIIDYIHRTNFAKSSYGSTITTSRDAYNGTMTATYAQHSGMMLPSYDANIAPTTVIDDTAIDSKYGSRYAAFYQFKEGTKYKFTFVYSTEFTDGNLKVLYANRYASGGVRDTTGETSVLKTVAAANGEYITSTYTFTHNPSESAETKVYTYGSGSNDDVTALAFRSGTATGFSITFDKIMITEISDDTTPYLDSAVTIDYNDGVTESETVYVKDGEQLTLPTPAEREGQIFIGWYRSTNTIDNQNIDNVLTTDNIVLPGYYIASGYEEVTLVPKYISNESVTVDFSEEIYGTLSNGTDLGGTDGQFSIVTDETIDADGGSEDNTYLKMDTVSLGKGANIYKTSLFKDDGSRYLVHEGVNYKIDVRYRVDSPVTSNRGYYGISMCRSGVKAYKPDGLEGANENCSLLVNASKTTDKFMTASKTYHNKFMYVAVPGSTSDLYDKNYNNQLAVMITDGIVYVDYITVTPLSYDPSYINYDETKGTVNVDYLNGNIEIIPNDGYEVAPNGVNVLMKYKDYSISGTKLSVVTNPTEHLSLNTTDGVNYTFSTNYPDYTKKLGALVITVDFVEEAETNTDMIAASIRTETAESETTKYQSAGIRFRSRTSVSDITAADEVGFIVMPTKALGGKSIEAYLKANPDETISVRAIAKDSTTDRTYETIGSYKDYQVALTGLTNKEGTLDLRGLKLTVAMYFKTGDTVKYVEYMHSKCYNDFAQ